MGLGRGVKIIEAMAADVPVVATDVGGVRELISGMFSSRQALCGTYGLDHDQGTLVIC